jgi:hypothetical protein
VVTELELELGVAMVGAGRATDQGRGREGGERGAAEGEDECERVSELGQPGGRRRKEEGAVGALVSEEIGTEQD